MAREERVKENRIEHNHQLDSHGLTFVAGIPVSTDGHDEYCVHLVPESQEIAESITQTPTLFDTASLSCTTVWELIQAKNEQRYGNGASSTGQKDRKTNL